MSGRASEQGPRDPAALADLLSGFVRTRRWAGRLQSLSVHSQWEELVGPDLARRCEPVRIAGGVLLIRTASPTWAAQLRYLTPRIQRRVAELVGEDQVRTVRVVVGPLEGLAD